MARQADGSTGQQPGQRPGQRPEQARPGAIAYFISPHGFGHAARSCAVIEAVWERAPDTRFELFTTVPAWFFEQSLEQPVGYHPATTDLGLVQKSSLEEDLDETVRRLRAWLPFRPRDRSDSPAARSSSTSPGQALDHLAAAVVDTGCELVVCDVSPLGLEVARHAAVPSLLIENFTWDWIYRAYASAQPALAGIADYLAEVFAGADRHIQTEPLCRRVAGAQVVPPIARRPRGERHGIRRRLEVPPDAQLVMVTMGGVEWQYEGIETRLATRPKERRHRDRWLVIPGGSPEPRRLGQAVLLPHRSEFYHPDLIQASDAVIGKLGYSTVAEVYDAGVPFGYVPRPTFPESPPVESWVRRHLPSRRVDAASFVSWDWLDEIDPLLELPRGRRHAPGGAGTIAEGILEMI